MSADVPTDSKPLTAALARISIDWLAGTEDRRDTYDELLAYSLATYVDGVPITPLGYAVSEKLGGETA